MSKSRDGGIPIDTSNILFICSGAFSGMEKIVKRRMNVELNQKIKNKEEQQQRNEEKDKETKSKIEEDERFHKINQLSASDLMLSSTPGDLVSYGLIPEFVGRFPLIVSTEQLTHPEMVQVLTEPKNALIKQYQYMFGLHDVSLKFSDLALESIAQQALDRNTGARGLRSILERIMLNEMFNLPERGDGSSSTIEIDEDMVQES